MPSQGTLGRTRADLRTSERTKLVTGQERAESDCRIVAGKSLFEDADAVGRIGREVIRRRLAEPGDRIANADPDDQSVTDRITDFDIGHRPVVEDWYVPTGQPLGI